MGDTAKSVLGGFRLLNRLGSGGEGMVYKAVCEQNVHKIVGKGTVVALKISHVHGVDADEKWKKLQIQIDELRRLNDPHVVRHLGCFREQGPDGDVHVVVQELLEGRTLREMLASSRLGIDVDEGKRVVGMVLQGLEHAAEHGICHRDIKPSNIFLCTNGGVKLIDFGVAKQVELDLSISEADNVRGTWNYMAPDFMSPSFRGDFRSDIFSVGALLHEMLVGKLPYANLDNLGMGGYYLRWSQQATADAPAIRIDPLVGRLLIGVEEVLSKALARNPDDRYASFKDFNKALERVEFVYTKSEARTYQRLKFVGKGGFGEVFKARCLETRELVAVKSLLNPDYAYRFRQEASTMRQLDDPCFVKFVDFFELRDGAYLVMRFLDGMPGSSVQDAIQRACEGDRGGLPKGLVLSAFERYARGLAVLHGRGIIHRDIKPGNLYYPEEHPDRVAIMDFGIVRELDATMSVNRVPCTPDYAPPEIVITDDRGGPGMDIFALGLCLYEALTGGRKSYPTLASGMTGYNALYERAKAMQEPDFDDPRIQSDRELLALLRRMTDPDVSVRMNDAGEVAREIRKLFYRPSTDPACPPTDVFGQSPNPDLPIDDKKLLEWYGKWRNAHPEIKSPLIDDDSQTWHPVPPKPSWKAGTAVALVFTVLGVAVFAFWNPLSNRLSPVSTQPVPVPLVVTNEVPVVVTNEVSAVVTNAPVPADYLELKRKTFEHEELDPLLKNEPVANRRDRILRADKRLQDAIKSNLFSPESAEPLKKKIDRAKKYVVGSVKNDCDGDLVVDGKSLRAGEERVFVFEDGKPSGHKMLLKGYAERPVPSNLDGKKIVVTTNDFKVSAVKMALPALDNGVTCIFDGKPVVETGLSLVPGAYECVYRKDGYDDQKVAFRALLGTDGVIPSPSEWLPTPVDVTLPPLEKGIVCLIDGRQAEYVQKLMPGEHKVEYQREGHFNQTNTFKAELAKTVDVPAPGAWRILKAVVSVPELEDGVVCRIDGKEVTTPTELPLGMHTNVYTRNGYENQTNELEILDATPMTLKRPNTWIELPVEVTLPTLDADVVCKVDGNQVEKAVSVKPGSHIYEYMREGFQAQYGNFTVSVGRPITLPSPGDWKSTVIPAPKPEQPSNDSSPSYKKALEWYDDYKEYGEALQKFYDALQEGWRPSEDDMVKIQDAFENRRKYLDDIIRKVEAQISIGQTPLRDPEAVRKERNDAIKWYDALKNAR